MTWRPLTGSARLLNSPSQLSTRTPISPLESSVNESQSRRSRTAGPALPWCLCTLVVNKNSPMQTVLHTPRVASGRRGMMHQVIWICREIRYAGCDGV